MRFISISETKAVMYPPTGEPGITETWIAATGKDNINSNQFFNYEGTTYYLVTTKEDDSEQ